VGHSFFQCCTDFKRDKEKKQNYSQQNNFDSKERKYCSRIVAPQQLIPVSCGFMM